MGHNCTGLNYIGLRAIDSFLRAIRILASIVEAV